MSKLPATVPQPQAIPNCPRCCDLPFIDDEGNLDLWLCEDCYADLDEQARREMAESGARDLAEDRAADLAGRDF